MGPDSRYRQKGRVRNADHLLAYRDVFISIGCASLNHFRGKRSDKGYTSFAGCKRKKEIGLVLLFFQFA